MDSLRQLGAAIDSPRAAGLLALGALGVLVLLRRGFAGVTVKIGD